MRDVHDLQKWGVQDDPRYSHYTFSDFSDAEIKTWFRTKQKIALKKLYGLFVGGFMVAIATIRRKDIFSKRAEIGIAVDPDFLSQGFGTEMLKMHIDNIFTKMHMDIITLRVAAFNDRAISCYLNLGFIAEPDPFLMAYEYQGNKQTLLAKYPQLFGESEGKLTATFRIMHLYKKTQQLKAPAKINLGLRILGKRSDGYHEIESVMQSISLYDHITLAPDVERSLGGKISFTGPGPGGENNLVYKAAQLMQQKYNLGGMRIHLRKNIPMAAGLGGGSADAAATINAINQVFGLELSSSEMEKIGLELGADIPFCISPGSAIAAGVGEKLNRFTLGGKYYLCLVVPETEISTAEIFKEYDKDPAGAVLEEHSPKHSPEHLAELSPEHSPELSPEHSPENLPQKVAKILQSGGLDFGKFLANDLLNAASRRTDEIEAAIDQLKALGAVEAQMSGSGPSVYGIFKDQQDAIDAHMVLKIVYKRCYCVKMLGGFYEGR